ncbi:MAG: hypothetical protein KA436_11775 [Oligoflexales bacterium]|nr:hypothetical protein [Oligoflexales bacterium]
MYCLLIVWASPGRIDLAYGEGEHRGARLLPSLTAPPTMEESPVAVADLKLLVK